MGGEIPRGVDRLQVAWRPAARSSDSAAETLAGVRALSWLLPACSLFDPGKGVVPFVRLSRAAELPAVFWRSAPRTTRPPPE